jgi:hypothetical protein
MAGKTRAPKNATKNTGFWMASLICCMASMKVRSSVRPRPIITEHAKA